MVMERVTDKTGVADNTTVGGGGGAQYKAVPAWYGENGATSTNGRDITFMEDMRSSSDIQDDDKTSESVTRQPRNFTVKNSPTTGWLRFSVQGDVTPNERQYAQAYRVYFIPYSAGTTDPSNTAKRTLGTAAEQKAALNAGLWTINIDAAGRQNAYQADDNKFYGKQGWFFCVGVNRKGQEGRPTIAVPAP